jgi:hypothetical protein
LKQHEVIKIREDLVRKDVFEKMNFVRELLKATIPEFKGFSDNKLKLVMSHIGHFHIDNKPVLTELEIIAYDTLIRNDINPSTAYKWFNLTMLPVDYQHQLRTGRISQKQALRMHASRKRQLEISKGIQIIELVREAVGRL